MHLWRSKYHKKGTATYHNVPSESNELVKSIKYKPAITDFFTKNKEQRKKTANKNRDTK